ncbi:alpha/beta hydrolase [Noviherbaspirillum sp. ST9]|uniref:alpha/beta hydrolase n=1 Tax=Noviherbaspirillum sp. ST9 TaxID=3401606 RepID=UPI003B587A30
MTDTLDDLMPGSSLGLAHRVRTPSVASESGSPCLILLHGVGANEVHLTDLARQLDPRLTVLVARGPLEMGAARFGWFPVRFTPGGPVIDAAQAERAREALITFIDGLPAAYGIDRRRIWIGGFSQGGIMSASVALTAPERVAGFAVMSGRVLPEIAARMANPASLRHVRAFISHGIHDDKLGIQYARDAQSLVSRLGLRVQYREYSAGHLLTDEMQQDFCGWLAEQISQRGA